MGDGWFPNTDYKDLPEEGIEILKEHALSIKESIFSIFNFICGDNVVYKKTIEFILLFDVVNFLLNNS